MQKNPLTETTQFYQPGVQVFNNKATRLVTSILGATLAIAAFRHGFFEFLQGNKATDSILIQAIGEQHRFWVPGTEEAITIIPNYLITGLLTMSISIFAAIWSVRFIERKRGSTIFCSISLHCIW